jgi:hypothetical protein
MGRDPGGVVAPARREPAVAITHAGFGLLRLGVAQQHQSHVGGSAAWLLSSIDFFGAAV